MGRCFLYGNGGSGGDIKLTVFNGTTAPANPQDNYVWIKTTASLDDLLVCGKSWPSISRAGRIWLQYEDVPSSSYQWLLRKTANVFVSIPLCGCAIANGTTWTKLEAYLYYAGEWHQFSKTFSATITVTYPAGAVCTVSNGSTTYTAPNTTGTWSCNVDSTGDWTVKATKGSQNASSVVSITSDGQSSSVSLSYDYIVFQAGGASDYSGGWTAVGYATVTKVDSEGIKVYTASSWNGAQVFSNAAFDVSNYSKLNINVIAYNSARPEASFGLSRNQPANQYWNTGGSANKTNCAATLAITSAGVKTLDISNLSGSFYFWTGEDGALSDYLGYTIGTIWLS